MAAVASQDRAESERELAAVCQELVNVEKSQLNLLLIHACDCDHVQCRSHQFHERCAYMKQFLRAVCWASHNTRWRSCLIAGALTELFALHAMSCQRLQCNVPMCNQLRDQMQL